MTTMVKDILDAIESLTERDMKTLTQKALKTSEEVGELAQAVLSCTDAHGTSYKGKSRDNVLEEAADTIICAASVAFEAGFTTGDVGEAIVNKLQKWAKVIGDKEND